MSLLRRFDTPASLRDAPAGSTFYDAWHQYVDSELGDLVTGENGGAVYNPARTNVKTAGEKIMTWNGFPRRVLLPNLRDNKPAAYAACDVIRNNENHPQDEYFEWYVHRNTKGKIQKITFVTELRQYYETLWEVDPDLVLKIYQKNVDSSVKLSELRDSANQYNFLNRWNTEDGILHYTQGINRLDAAIGLAKSLTVDDPPATDNYVANPPFASTTTSVDPRVSYDIHMLVRKGLFVTLKDPIGIYILSWDNSGIRQPDGRPAPFGWWKVRRGIPGRVLRLEYEVPQKLGFSVSDLTLGGQTIEFGGQLAEQVTVGLPGIAGTRIGIA